MTPIENLIASNFTETNRVLDDLLKQLTIINENLKEINEKLDIPE